MGRTYRNYDEEDYEGFNGDDGVDAIKDANAEMGLDPYNPKGFRSAVERGWLKPKKKDAKDLQP